MFRVREGLKLARAAGIPSAKRFILHGGSQNLREELRLRLKTFGRQSDGFAGFLNGGKIDLRGEVLFAGAGQKIVADVMPEIRAERAACAAGRKDFVSGVAVINREQPAVRPNASGFAPPVFGSGRSFDGVVVGENLQKRRWQMADGGWQIRFRALDFRPREFFPFDGDAPLKPIFCSGVPAEAVDGHGVEKFVAENDASEF